MLELILILPVKLHTSSQKRILGLRNTGLLLGICQMSVVKRDALLQLHQAAASIINAVRIIELTSPITHSIILHINGTSYLVKLSSNFFLTQRGLQQNIKELVKKRYPQM